MAYLRKKIASWRGGYTTDHPASMRDDALSEAVNVVLTPEGKVAPRPGIKKRFASDFSSSPVLGMGALYKSDGTSRLVMASGTSLYVDNPHLTYEYDTREAFEQTGTYSNSDTASAAGDVKMYTPPAAVLTGTPTYAKIFS